MNITKVDFICYVNFGGSINTANNKSVVGDRPGQKAMSITPVTLDGVAFVRLERETGNGEKHVKLVPMTNVSGLDVEEPKVEAKKEAKK